MSASLPKGYQLGKFQKYTPQQMKLFNNLFSYLGPDSYLAKLAAGDEEMFADIEAPALRQFAETQGNIASRFSGMGSGGRKSSGFQNTMNKAASSLSQDLQSQRQGLQNQALQELMSFSNQLLGQSPYEQFLIQEQQKPGFFDQLVKYGAPIVGGMMGGPAGFGAGSTFGNWWANKGF